MKDNLLNYLDSISSNLFELSDYIFDNPENGLEEFKALESLTNSLEVDGFKVEKGVGGLETSFRASYSNGTGGPRIGLLVEYDAIESVGHACGHQMQGPIGIGVAKAIKNILKENNYTLIVYGTPAEETIGGKLTMIKNGCFKDIDVALMAHGGPETTTDIKSMAMAKYKVIFKGKKAHAALRPEAGRSALDALLLTFNGIEFLREHIPDDARIHYTVLEAGGPANVVSDKAVGSFYVRSYDNKTLINCKERFEKIIQGACLMTETSSEIILEKEMGGKIPVISLNDLVMKHSKELNAPTLRPPREKTGSTDFGSVMAMVPGTCLRIAFVPEGTSSHSDEYLASGKSKEAHDAILLASKILTLSVFDIITDNDLFLEIKEEFKIKNI